jgi:hypothetical protein
MHNRILLLPPLLLLSLHHRQLVVVVRESLPNWTLAIEVLATIAVRANHQSSRRRRRWVRELVCSREKNGVSWRQTPIQRQLEQPRRILIFNRAMINLPRKIPLNRKRAVGTISAIIHTKRQQHQHQSRTPRMISLIPFRATLWISKWASTIACEVTRSVN